MKQQQIISQTVLPSKKHCRVFYNKVQDSVEVELDGISLRFEARSFILMNEMFRKAAARIVMQTEIAAY